MTQFKLGRHFVAAAGLCFLGAYLVAAGSPERFGAQSDDPPAVPAPTLAPEEGDHDGEPQLPRQGKQVSAAEYVSPYSFAFVTPMSELLFDAESARGDWRNEASIPYAEWYSDATRERFRGWGPRMRLFECPPAVHAWTIEKKRERLLASAQRWLGRDYQHHHCPDWDPPLDWPWNPSKTIPAHQSRGIDCSGFTSFVYQWALGISIPTNVLIQSRAQRARIHIEGRQPYEFPVRRIEKPADFATLRQTLQAGDLLFITDTQGAACGHAILWCGELAKSPDGAALILDSTGFGHIDSNGFEIPCGVRLRPMTEASWYWKCFSHAIRVIGE